LISPPRGAKLVALGERFEVTPGGAVSRAAVTGIIFQIFSFLDLFLSYS